MHHRGVYGALMEKNEAEQRETETLVELVRDKPHLYDPSDSDYKNNFAKDNSWREIAEKLNVPVDQAKKKWKNIRDTYVKSRTKLSKTTSGSAATSQSKWIYYDILDFLSDTIRPRKTFSNIIVPEATIETMSQSEDKENSNIELESPSTEHFAGPPIKKKRNTVNSIDEEILATIKTIHNPQSQDVNDCFGRTVAMELKGLPPNRQAFARMKLSESLYEIVQACTNSAYSSDCLNLLA